MLERLRLSGPLKHDMDAYSLKTDEIRMIVKQQGFRVEVLAAHLGLGVRTLERRFRDQLRATPKAWLIHERMSLALPLLAEGLPNKQVAAVLHYTCESNFSRDFKRYFGYTPLRRRI